MSFPLGNLRLFLLVATSLPLTASIQIRLNIPLSNELDYESDQAYPQGTIEILNSKGKVRMSGIVSITSQFDKNGVPVSKKPSTKSESSTQPNNVSRSKSHSHSKDPTTPKSTSKKIFKNLKIKDDAHLSPTSKPTKATTSKPSTTAAPKKATKTPDKPSKQSLADSSLITPGSINDPRSFTALASSSVSGKGKSGFSMSRSGKGTKEENKALANMMSMSSLSMSDDAFAPAISEADDVPIMSTTSKPKKGANRMFKFGPYKGRSRL